MIFKYIKTKFFLLFELEDFPLELKWNTLLEQVVLNQNSSDMLQNCSNQWVFVIRGDFLFKQSEKVVSIAPIVPMCKCSCSS